MAFVENTAPFFADFGIVGVLDGAPVAGILDKHSEVDGGDGLVTQAPVFMLPTLSAPSVAVGSSLTAAAVIYTVRQVLRVAPDGVMTQLILARA